MPRSTTTSGAPRFPEERWVTAVLRALEESEEGMGIRELERSLNLRYGQIEKVLKVLSVDNPAPIMLGKLPSGDGPPFPIRSTSNALPG